jgi:sn-glycerol 3-phosphate transport system ATP-binding protein
LGVRPEHLHLAGSDAAAMHLKVQMVETLGADILAHGAVAGANGTGESLTLRLPGSAKVGEGETLPLAADPGALHLFDPDSGRRIADI